MSRMKRGWRWRAPSRRRRKLRRPRCNIGCRAKARPRQRHSPKSLIPRYQFLSARLFSLPLGTRTGTITHRTIKHHTHTHTPDIHPPSPARSRSKRVHGGGGRRTKKSPTRGRHDKTNRARLLFCFCAGLTPLRLLVFPPPSAHRPLRTMTCTNHLFLGFLLHSFHDPSILLDVEPILLFPPSFFLL